MVTNLVGNAVKFTNIGGVTASLQYDENKKHLCCEVADTGIGVPEEKKRDIFQKFIQGDPSISRQYGGTGLGLAITYHLVTLMGGEIAFDSTEGHGSRFWFTLPVKTATAGDEIIAADTRHPHEKAFMQAGDARILIAEDHPVNQLLLIKLLKKFGFAHIETVDDGSEALKKLSANTYDMVLMDCQMPKMDGYAATRQLRLREMQGIIRLRTPVIAITAHTMTDDREHCIEAGMDEYISKPLEPEKLKFLLSRWFVLPSNGDTAPPPIDATDILDRSRLRMAAETPQEEREVLDMFFRLAHEKLEIMQKSRRESELRTWGAAAHYLTGSASNLGMKMLAEKCRLAETAPFSTRQCDVLIEDIKIEIARIKSHLGSS